MLALMATSCIGDANRLKTSGLRPRQRCGRVQLAMPAFILDGIIELRVEMSGRVLRSEDGRRLTHIRLSGIERI